MTERSRIFGEYSGLLIRASAIVLAIVLWQVYSTTQPPYLFPGWPLIWEAFVEQVTNPEYDLVTSFIDTMKALTAGYLLAVVVGITVGIGLGLNDTVSAIFDPYVSALYTTPMATVVPIVILLNGTNFTTYAFMVFLFCVFEILVNVYEGVENTPRGLLDVARSFGASRWFVISRVVFTADLPYIFTGLRLGIGRAIKGVIITQLLIEFIHIGRIIRLWQNSFRIAGVISVVIFLMVLGVVLTKSVAVLEDWILDWRTEVEL